MTAPSIRKVLIHTLASLAASISLLERTPRAKKAAPSDKMFDQMIADYKAALEQGRAALSAPPQDVVEGIVSLLKENIRIQVYGDDATAQIRDDNLTLCATAILASGLVTASRPSRKITMSDVRLIAGEGKLSAHDVLAAVNAHLRLHPIGPDEAAIRADEREKCARVAERTPLNSYDAGECRADIAAAIRAGGAK